MKQQRYKIVSGPDQTHWLPLEPMLLDIIDQMDDENVKQNADVLHSLEVVKVFIQAMIQEGRQNDLVTSHQSKDDDSEASYSQIITQ